MTDSFASEHASNQLHSFFFHRPMPTLVIRVLELQLDKQGIYCRAAVLDHIIESVSDIVAANA